MITRTSFSRIPLPPAVAGFPGSPQKHAVPHSNLLQPIAQRALLRAANRIATIGRAAQTLI